MAAGIGGITGGAGGIAPSSGASSDSSGELDASSKFGNVQTNNTPLYIAAGVAVVLILISLRK